MTSMMVFVQNVLDYIIVKQELKYLGGDYMAVVTDKQYYLDDNLIRKLKDMKKRQDKNHDNVLIIDGPEGFGKSTIATQIGYFYGQLE